MITSVVMNTIRPTVRSNAARIGGEFDLLKLRSVTTTDIKYLMCSPHIHRILPLLRNAASIQKLTHSIVLDVLVMVLRLTIDRPASHLHSFVGLTLSDSLYVYSLKFLPRTLGF